MLSTETFRENLSRIRDRIGAATRKCGRAPEDITLIGVSKRKPLTDLITAVDNGLADIGENRIQEAREKLPGLEDRPVRRHLIGHLQKNKVRFLPGLFDIVHSVDSVGLAERISSRFAGEGTRLPILLQVNVSGEASKSGVSPEAASDLTGACLELPGIEIRGYMTIGPLTSDPEQVRQVFRKMRQLVERQWQEFRPGPTPPWLSMGMSGDFEIAIQEGATHIRIGTALFGPRE